MRIAVNGTRLWFDVDGPGLVPDGQRMCEQPTLLLIHGGPGSYDHSYLKPHFAPLARHAQVVYLDLRGHGRSAREPSDWTFEACADDVAAFCDALGIIRPVILGHSMGGIIAMLAEARRPGIAAALILQSTMARFDLERLVEGFRTFGGDEVAELARRDYQGDGVTDAEWARVFAVFGPRVPDPDELARRSQNPELGESGMEQLRALDAIDQLARVTCPTLVCVGAADAVTPVAVSQEIVDALPPGVGRLEVIEAAGHFPWLDRPDAYASVIGEFVATAGRR